MSTRFFACIYLDRFRVAVARHLQPTLLGKPVIIGGDPRQHGQVIEASPEAQDRGIHPGMATWEALRRCPDAALARHDDAAVAALSRQISGRLEEYSPRVENPGLGCFFMELTCGGPPLLEGRAVQDRLHRDLALSCAIGIAANRLTAGMAARGREPGALALAPAGEEAAFLAPLPTDLLPDLDPPLRERLSTLSIKTIGDLQTMPIGMLAAHFGKEGRRLYHMARGMDGDMPAGSPAAGEAFDRRLADPEDLRRWAIFLCSRVGRQLRESRQTARIVTITLGHPERPPTALTGRLPRPSDVDQLLFQAAEQALRDCQLPGEGVISMTIAAGGLEEEKQQLTLFPDRSAWRDARLRIVNSTANRIERKHGEGAILVASILDNEIVQRLRGRWHERAA